MVARKTVRNALSYVTCLAAWAIAAGMPLVASAATRTVTNLNDSGTGSLRDAVTQSNVSPDFDRIIFASNLTGTINFSSTISITSDLSIEGPGPRVISFSGGKSLRLFAVSSPTAASFFGVRFANGFTDRGAAIVFTPPAGSTLLTVEDCHFDQNTVTVDGGAICVLGGSLSAKRCTFTTCQAASNGGCIWWGQGAGSPTVEVANCTFVNNFASNAGGALRQYNTTAYASRLTNCTFVVNNAGNGGGAIALAGGTMSMRNLLFAANAAGGNPGGHIRTAGGTLTSLGGNLIGHIDGATFTPATGDQFGTVASQLNVGVLIAFPFNNGGLTDTIPLFANSIAIDAGLADPAAPGDQRNFPRVGCAPDVGAFEVQTITDSDADGVMNCLDQCPNTPACASVNQVGCPTDADADGVADGCDQCPGTIAGEPVDASGCSTVDSDGDGVLNDADHCKGTPACAVVSVDVFGCPSDSDGDGLFDGCDQCLGSNDRTDTDADGIPDCLDPCPNAIDTDGDGLQDCQDGCPNDAAKQAAGACGCGTADTDSDADGTPDCLDGCPATPACATLARNGCPIFADADNVPDGCDACPGTVAGDPTDAFGCSTADEDGDGVLNDQDRCKGTPACAKASIDANGCPADSDGDGLFDGCDQCPGSNDRTDTDADGIPDCLDPCPNAKDSDGDGVQDCQDGCPADALKIAPGTCGCGSLDTDTDGDGAPDCLDPCPNALDGDGDGVQDCQDGCPTDALKIAPGTCGCGVTDADANGNGFADCLDAAVSQLAGQPTPTLDGTSNNVNPAAPVCGAGVTSCATMMLSLLWLMATRRGHRRV